MGLKDLMKSFLFENVESDDDDYEEEEEEEAAAPVQSVKSEPVRTSAPVSAPVQQTAAQTAPSIPAEPSVQTMEQKTDEFIAQQTAASQPTSASFFSQVEGIMDDDDLEEKKKSNAKRTVRRSANRQPQPNVNYTAVLSPIFGNLPNEDHDHKAIHDAINLPEASDEMTQIISPMYGNTPKPKKKPRPVHKAAPAAAAEQKQSVKTKTASAAASEEETEVKAETKPEPEKAAPVSSSKKVAPARRSRISGSMLNEAKAKSQAANDSMDLASYLSRPAKSSAPKAEKQAELAADDSAAKPAEEGASK